MAQMNLTVPQAPERFGPVILSTAKDLPADRERPFAVLRACPEWNEGMTWYGCSNCQAHLVHIEPCLKLIRSHLLKVLVKRLKYESVKSFVEVVLDHWGNLPENSMAKQLR